MLVLDHGSREPLPPDLARRFDADIDYRFVRTDAVSPVAAINAAAAEVTSPLLMISIDGGWGAYPEPGPAGLGATSRPAVCRPAHLYPGLAASPRRRSSWSWRPCWSRCFAPTPTAADTHRCRPPSPRSPVVCWPDKGATLLETLHTLKITPSFGRPHVSNDNAFSDALFRTCKYVPDYPVNGFECLQASQRWVQHFVRWYNTEHRHSAIRFVTPDERHRGEDHAVLAKRHALTLAARAAHPERWSGKTRNWNPIAVVSLNPQRAPDTTPINKLE